jgi:peptidoglycan-N-acetylglucosamine deacetylase
MTTPSASPHRIPRYPHAWAWLLMLSQLLVTAAWWHWGWTLGLPLMLVSHAPLWWGTLWPQSALFGPVLNRLPTDDRVVWLTIDDGPSDDTLAVLDALDAHDAKATFFLVGERAAVHPERVREILRRGHGIGNHSATHPARWFWALGPVRMRREIAETQKILADISGEPPRWFRAVVGMSNPFVNAGLKAHGLARVAWNVRGFDAMEADPQTVIARIERNLAPGAIVLLHEGAAHGRNVETIVLLLKRLDALRYRTSIPKPL